MSAPALAPPPGGDQTRGPQLLAIYWVQTGIAIIVVALRFYVRRAKRIIGLEDWAMLVCLTLYTTGSALLPVLIHYGIGRHIYYVPPENLVHVIRWNWIIQPFGIMSQPFGKISVSIFLLGLMGPKSFWRRWFLYVNMGLFTLLACLCAIFTYVQCNPPRALWEEVPGAKCWKPESQADIGIATTAYGAAFDYSLSVLPLTILWNLKMEMRRKVVLYILLGFSVFSGISATVKAVQLKELGVRTDVTWDTFSLYAWASSELFVNIVCGSIPMLKPLYDQWSTGRPLSADNSYQQSSDNSKRHIVSSNNSKSPSGGWSFRSVVSTNASVGRSANRNGSKEAITIVQSYDVQSKTDSIVTEEVR